MRSHNDPAIDLERLEMQLFPADLPAEADMVVEERRLPYDLTGPRLSPALVRLVEHYGLPERPLVTSRGDDDADGEYQVVAGSSWIRAGREAGVDRLPVRALEVSEVSAAFLGLVLNQGRGADVAAQADALQALLEAGFDETELVRSSGLGRARLRRLAALLELHPVLRQGLRDGRVPPQAAFAAAGLSETTQSGLAAIYEEAGELTGADVRLAGGTSADGASTTDPTAEEGPESDAATAMISNGADPTARARRQAEALLRTLEEASVSADIRERVAMVVEDLARLALV